MSRRRSKQHTAESISRRYALEHNLWGEHPVRNRFEKRVRIKAMPREFRIHVHGMGQWVRKVIKNGELTRP
jgi:hypothetical protein